MLRELRYGGKAQIGQIFHFMNFQFDLLVVGIFASLASVGYYAVAQTLAQLAIYLGVAFQISILPLVSRLEGDARQTETTQRAVRHHGILALVVIAMNAVFAPFVLVLGYGAGFRPALVPLLILLPSMWFLGTGNLISGDLRGRGRPGLASLLKGVTAALTVALDFALIPSFGVVGAAVASCITYTFFGVLSIVVLARVAGIPVRQLAVPTRDDLAAYPAGARALARRLRRKPPAVSSEPTPA
jgi:O-antigen/teichoic acid export membrane protein